MLYHNETIVYEFYLYPNVTYTPVFNILEWRQLISLFAQELYYFTCCDISPIIELMNPQTSNEIFSLYSIMDCLNKKKANCLQEKLLM